ncbi:hypothetical protein KKF09_01750, partial [Patescibacteria group bacterium]|nr:hypothetical protein [Patescibacteria group bacterium]
ACQSAEGGQLGGNVSAIPLARGRQNRKIFFSLIEKNFGGARLKKCRENFSVLLAEVRAEGEGEAEHSSNSLWRRVRDSNS